MSKTRTIGLTAAAFVACAGSAAAATVTQVQSVAWGVSPPVSNFTHTFSFNGFNSSLGTLTSVTDTLSQTFMSFIFVTNNSSSSGIVTSVSQSTDVTKSFGTALTVHSTGVGMLTGVPPPVAASATAVLSISGSGSATATTTTGLSYFETAIVSATAFAGASTPSVAPGNFSFTDPDAPFDTSGTITDKLVYTYTPAAAAVPEPSSLALVGSGLFGLLGIFRRRKRRPRDSGPAGPP